MGNTGEVLCIPEAHRLTGWLPEGSHRSRYMLVASTTPRAGNSRLKPEQEKRGVHGSPRILLEA
jgi:hypothetical protein